ncbi:MAG: LamG domain-containing protein, partial [Prevotella sp.]|nr:LamG domain-containing protein [Prevotella sp.]
LGMDAIDAGKYTCERTGADNIRFTAPKLPDDIPSKVNDVRSRYCTYDVAYIFYKQDGSKETIKESFDCDKYQAKSYDTAIPETVGNPKRIDVNVTARQGVKDPKADFWSQSSAYNKNNVFQVVPVPGGITTEYRQFDKTTALSWSQPTDGNYLTCTSYIYRVEADASGNIQSGKSWSRRGNLDNSGTSMSYTDDGVQAGAYYKYMVLNVPKDWIGKSINSSMLSSPDDAMLNKLGYSISDGMSTAPNMSIYTLQQDTTVTDKVKLTWQYSRVPTEAATVNFKILRKTTEEGDWTEYGSVTGDAQPAAGASLSFVDTDLPNVSTRYQYKVRLSLIDDKYRFESDAVYAGLLSGSQLKDFEATKGTHDATVRLSWTANQIGSENSTYVLSRRYVNSSSEFMRIHTANGTSELYTYEDNTVQPGYYYEYKIEVYSGNTLQNTLYDVGFCQARGVISGRVTFGSGSAVEDVRLSLRPSNTGDDNVVKGASQYVDGASTGIAWEADSAEMAKVFGSDKDYTVQMFVRPDGGLSEGAVIGEIPGEGRIAVGSQTADGYELVHMVPAMSKAEEIDLSTLTADYVAQDRNILTGTLTGRYKIAIADGATVKLKDVTISGTNSTSYKWAGINCLGDAVIVLSGSNTVKGFYEDYPGIFVPQGKTLTICGDGSLHASSNGYGAGIGTGYSTSCGNIVIEGGTITATGGTYAAGIGGGETSSCGNITITGGSIDATGGNYAPGIGCGRDGSCGAITIASTVTTLTATKGNGATNSIGRSTSSARCDTVSIDGTVYWNGSSYQNGGELASYGIVQSSYEFDGNGNWVNTDQSNNLFKPQLVYSKATTGLTLPDDTYSLLTVSRTGSQLNIQIANNEPKTLSATKIPQLALFSVGGANGVTEEKAFRGNLAEVRVWNHVLNDKEKESYADRVLNGREQGLALYWPMDEGLNRYVFDASYANDMPNGRHAKVGNNISASSIVPVDNQLSRYAVTNENGEYIIRGIPFVGSGSTYTITPTRGIHEFSPLSRNGFIGNGSLTLNSYDFTDVSSFPVRGKVTYLNTNIPVDSVQFMIDGNLVQSKEGVRSDANGEFEIAVPIGKHLIECYMNGHRFTSFPLDGSTYDFKRAETVNFVDSTLVNVTGRINGGFTDLNEPVGFNRSVNRLGKATIKLSLGKESQCSFNYIVDSHGDGTFGTENIPVESASDSIQSTAYRAGGNHDDTYFIYITTDEKTGEFSAMLPPLKYKVESIKFVGGTDYDNEPIFAQNLPMIDASNAINEKMKQDSLEVGDQMRYYRYSAKMLRQYRANPSIAVMQEGQKNGAFGEKSIAVTNLDNTVDTVQVVRYTQNGYEYVYGHPLFQQGKYYDFGIDIFERYVNLDTRKEYKEIPQDAVFTIMNDASATTTVYGEKATINGEEVEVGEAYKTLSIQISPDEKGHIDYQWEGGFPNLATGNLRNVSIGVKVDGRTTMWQAPDSQTEALDLIMLGGVGSGTNFVTSGPQSVDMIIRRPPGSTSVASLTNKEITSYNHTTIYNNRNKKIGGGAYFSETPTWEIESGTVLGFAVLAKSKFKFVSQQTETFHGNWTDKDAYVDDRTYTVTEQMTTPSSMVIDLSTMSFAPEGGDTYVGRATNLLFSRGRILGLFKQDNGSFVITEKDGITVSESFGTKFAYPQAYILNTLIPNWEKIIRSKLEEGHINADHWDKNNLTVVPGKVIYYTKYKPGDEEFGRANGDLDYWSDEQLEATNGFPSYRMVDGTENKDQEDEVEYAINQIKIWRQRIADNEEDKLRAFGDAENLIENYSIASGTKVSMTTETSRKTGNTHANTYTFTWNQDMKYGPLVNDAGVNVIYSSVQSWGDGENKDTLTTKSNTVAWTMSDGDVRTALSVDVYKSPAGWGPIFRTRGGQTVNPYEGASYTKFYQKGTQLNEATMKVENPQLKVKGSSELTDVPTGSDAKFVLQLSNQSETNDICNYVLQVKEGSNPNGAILLVDGAVLSNGKDGRLIKMKGGETVEKTLIIRQSDPSIIDYEDIVVQLKSEKDPSIESDKVTLRVHFVPSSAHVDLAVDHTVLNQEYLKDNGGIIAKMYNLDRQDKNLQGIRLRFRRKGTDTWNVVKQWTTVDSLLTMGYEPMPQGSQFADSVAFAEDGLYELQAQTFGKYGNDDVTYESNIIEVTQDTHGPKILGMVSPEDGWLTYMNRNNMHIRFNEVLNGNSLSKSDNFRIEGGLNNAVATSAPDVAAQLNGKRIETDAMYDLANYDYAFDLWFYRQGDGTIVSVGTDDNLLSLSTHDDGMLRARIGNEDAVYDTNTRIPDNQWVYMALNYDRKDADNPENRITMLYATANDKKPIYVGENVIAKDLSSHGKLGIGGDGMTGMIAGLSIWNSDVTATELYEKRLEKRASYTPGLVGYWRMDEGHGTQITDLARSRHMHMDSESWYINNENRAAHLDGKETLKVDISTFNPSKTDNFAFEMWFRGDEADNNDAAALVSVENTVIGFSDGKLILTTTNNEITLSDNNYCDGNWHHLAFNVRRGTSAIAYIDGQAVKVLPEASVPGFSSHYLTIGGAYDGDAEINRFTGDVDEIRIWGAALDGALISKRMYERMDNSYPGLVGYFPMEEINRNEQGTVITTFSTANFGQKDSQLKIANSQSPTQALNAPALKPGSTKLRMEDTQFNFTVSADQVYFSFPDTSLPLMDGNDFVAKVDFIKDEHGNNSETAEWMFHADFASV